MGLGPERKDSKTFGTLTHPNFLCMFLYYLTSTFKFIIIVESNIASPVFNVLHAICVDG